MLRPEHFGQTEEQAKAHLEAAENRRWKKRARWAAFCAHRSGGDK